MHHITHQHFNIGVMGTLSSCLTKEMVSRKFALATERPHGQKTFPDISSGALCVPEERRETLLVSLVLQTQRV